MRETTSKSIANENHPSHEFQSCNWMLAGVVDYKLCDKNYDCEHCQFDRAMHAGAPSNNTGLSALPDSKMDSPVTQDRLFPTRAPADFQGYEHAATLFYHPCHVWARIEDDGNVRVGMDHIGRQTLWPPL